MRNDCDAALRIVGIGFGNGVLANEQNPSATLGEGNRRRQTRHAAADNQNFGRNGREPRRVEVRKKPSFFKWEAHQALQEESAQAYANRKNRLFQMRIRPISI